MKLSIYSKPIYVGTKKDVLKIANANLYIGVSELGGNLIVPISMLKIQREPFVAVGQPMYTPKEGGSKRVSTLTVHLDSASADKVSEIVTADFLKTEAKRLFGTDKAGEYEYVDGAWKHLNDRTFGTEEMSAEDSDWMGKVIGAAKDSLVKAQSELAKSQATAATAAAGAAAIAAATVQPQGAIDEKLKALAAGQ